MGFPFQLWHCVSTSITWKIPQFHSHQSSKLIPNSPLLSHGCQYTSLDNYSYGMVVYRLSTSVYRFNILLLALPALYTNNTVHWSLRVVQDTYSNTYKVFQKQYRIYFLLILIMHFRLRLCCTRFYRNFRMWHLINSLNENPI